MPDLLKILAVFTAIMLLQRLKWNVGYVLLSVSGLLALLYLMSPAAIISTVRTTVTAPVTIELFFALTMIRALEMIMREKEVMAGMMETSRRLLRRKRAVIVSMPMLIGLLPSLGGAYFSAPMVEESTKGLNMSREEKGYINYWFRHPWEFVLPLYPGIVLASALTKIELNRFIPANAVYASLLVVSGLVLSMRSVGGQFGERKLEETRHRKGLWNFFPVASVLFMVIFLHVELHYALALIVLSLFIYYGYSAGEIIKTLRCGFAMDVIVLILGIMIFKYTLEDCHAVAGLSAYFTDKSIPILPILILLPFISGLLTGITVGFVGSTFPLLISFAGGAHLNQMTLAFAAGFSGVLLSPVHLCLVLTREYFKADMAGIYRKILPGIVIIMTAAIAEYFILG
jgi:hypothetical protein